jgi:diguanylate cyclase (GGDEF)-like protein
MALIQQSRVRLRVADPERRSRWTRCLAAAGFDFSEPPAGEREPDADLILSDLESALAGASGDGTASALGQGLVVIGGEAAATIAADARLPLDALDREIVLACRLVLEIVRLRRERRSESEYRNVLAQLALTDPLTGVGNLRAWRLALQRVWADPNPKSVCVGVFDLDHFKTLNDTLGHAAGDEALRVAGKVLAATVRKEDFAARLGGDEFGVLWVGLEGEAAPAVVERVRARLSNRLAAVTNHLLTASAGYALASGGALPDPDGLLALADLGLRAAKRNGRGRTRSPSDEEQACGLPLAGTVEGRRIDPAPRPTDDSSTRPALFSQSPSRVE